MKYTARKMCRLEAECEFLYSLSHATSRRYGKLVKSAGVEQIRALSECVYNFDLFHPRESQDLKFRKAVIKIKKSTQLKKLFLKNQKAVQKILSIIFLTVITCECALAFTYDNPDDEDI